MTSRPDETTQPVSRTDRSDVLLRYASALQGVHDHGGLIELAQSVIMAELGYQHSWLFEYTDASLQWVRIYDVRSARAEAIDKLPLLDARNDPMLQEIATRSEPVVVVDARTDPRTNKAIVEELGNRTIISVPMAVDGLLLGGVSVGTFGEEGVRAPQPDELSLLTALSALTAVALARVQREVERKRSEQRQRELEAQVLHSQKLEALGVLAGGVAHDFNNLLVGVLGNANLAAERLADDAPALPFIKLIEQAAHRAAELTRQMLAYSGKGKVVISRQDVAELVRETRDFVASAAPKTVALDVEIDEGPEPAVVDADASQIRQVLLNLLMNGAESIGGAVGRVVTRVGVVSIEATTPAQQWVVGPPEAGSYVSVVVEDTGAGMNADTLTRVFEPFFSTKSQGRGLGMAAVLGIVRSHRGALRVDSQPEVGTTFTVLLPLSAPGEFADAEEPPEPVPLRRGRVLVADDEELVRTVVRAALEYDGFEVVEASDGRQALERLTGEASQLIGAIVDVTMPKLGGLAVVEQLRSSFPRLPVLLTSGYTEDPDVSRVANQTETAFLGKPFSIAALRTVLGQLLDAGADSSSD